MPSRKRWKSFPRAPQGFAEETGLPPLIAQLLYSRNVTSPEAADAFLTEDNATFHDPFLLPGMDTAVRRLAEALGSDETIGVFGDFDVDGVTATALLSHGLAEIGAKVAPYIPHRVTEGHGLNAEAVQALRESGVTLLITVDCGVTSHQEVSLAADLGMDVIITDHHVPPEQTPAALAVVDPKVSWSKYPFPELTGAGLALKLVQGFYQYREHAWPRELLELAALGTVADLAPLHDENRSIVREGLKRLRNSARPGIQALLRKAGRQGAAVNSEAISFGLAPRLNASGRLDHAITSYRLLTSASDVEAESLAEELETFNQERRRITEDAYAIARRKALDEKSLVLLIGDESFVPGISGLVASRLVDEFYRPSVVMSYEGDLVRASARSIPAFDMAGAFYQCQDLFERFGGHPMAAGFVTSRERVPELQRRLEEIGEQQLGGMELEPTLMIDAAALPSNLMGPAFKWLNMLEPHGAGNPKPVFMAKQMKVLHSRTVGADGLHLSLKMSDGRATWNGIAFRQGDRQVDRNELLDVAYNLTTNRWDGQDALEMNVLDFRPSEG